MFSFLMVLYGLALVGFFFYSSNCYYLIYLYTKHLPGREEADRKYIKEFWQETSKEDSPRVTIQLPVYNEKYVLPRLIETACEIDYPRELLEIQVLDDSTDETAELAGAYVKKYQRKGINIKHVRRFNRKGFKAGALKEGMKTAEGDFLAIFDADFLPSPDFLYNTLPFFNDPRIAMVQSRWGHVNRNYSLITRIMSIGIDGHFMIEQGARNWSGLFMNFNGTAGIWRKTSIIDSGGWQADTLTEDMDLSYRCQLKGWNLKFVHFLVTPAEIPVDVNALKSQQFRWAKGSIQTAKKILPEILSSRLPFRFKFQAVAHLTHYLIHPLILLVALLSVPILLYGNFTMSVYIYTAFLIILIISSSGPSILYAVSQRSLGDDWKVKLRLLPAMMALGTGIAVSNSKAVLEAVFNIESDFIRTPKLNVVDKNDPIKRRENYSLPLNITLAAEIFMSLYCLYGVVLFLTRRYFLLGPFLIIYAIGFSSVALLSVFHRLKKEAG